MTFSRKRLWSCVSIHSTYQSSCKRVRLKSPPPPYTHSSTTIDSNVAHVLSNVAHVALHHVRRLHVDCQYQWYDGKPPLVQCCPINIQVPTSPFSASRMIYQPNVNPIVMDKWQFHYHPHMHVLLSLATADPIIISYCKSALLTNVNLIITDSCKFHYQYHCRSHHWPL